MRYFNLNEYTQVLNQLKDLKLDFETWQTSYSKKIKVGGESMFFSEDRTPTKVMQLIRNVRKDADLFIMKNVGKNGDSDTLKTDITSYEIDFCKFIDKPSYKSKKIITGYKIDLNSAYWQTAINMGAIKKDTDEFLKSIDFGYDRYGNKKNNKKLTKSARLKALGSLATRKIHDVYKEGVIQSDLMTVQTNKLQRMLYLNICLRVSEIMSELVYEFFDNVLYYYWDCVFIDDKIDPALIMEKVRNLGYDCKIEGVKTDFIINRNTSTASLLDKNSGKNYSIDSNEIIY